MTWPTGVAMQLVLRAIPSAGGVLNRGQYLEPALRTAVLVDLLLAERIEAADDAYTIDTDRTGFAPADVLLAEIDSHPDQTIEQWIGAGPDLVTPVVAEWVALGVIQRAGQIRERYAIDRRLHRLPAYKARDPQVAACVTVLASMAGLPGLAVVTDAAQRCGDAGWLIQLAHAYLDEERFVWDTGRSIVADFSGGAWGAGA